MRIGVVAQRVLRRGGMDRAAAELVQRLVPRHDVTVLAMSCDLRAPRLTWIPLPQIRGRGIVRSLAFDRAVRARRAHLQGSLINSVGATGADVHVITAHWCQSAFEATCGSIRGEGSGWRRVYHAGVERLETMRERAAYRSPSLRAVIAVSHGLKRELVEHHGVPDERAVVIPNGVDPTVFRPAADHAAKLTLRRERGLPETAFLCVFAGGDWERKGLRHAIHAVAGLSDVVLVVVGPGDIAKFELVARRAGASGQVIFSGSSEAPEAYFAAGDAFVFPSRYEAFPLAPLEAAACGLPVIAPRINGVEEWLRDGETGCVVQHDPDSIRAGLLTLRDSPTRLASMSCAAVACARRYTWDEVARRQVEVFEAVAAELGGTPRTPRGLGGLHRQDDTAPRKQVRPPPSRVAQSGA